MDDWEVLVWFPEWLEFPGFTTSVLTVWLTQFHDHRHRRIFLCQLRGRAVKLTSNLHFGAKNEWIYSSILLYVFMVWWLIQQTGLFILPWSNRMEQSPWQSNSRSAIKEKLLVVLEVSYLRHDRSPLDLILSQINPYVTSHPIIVRYILLSFPIYTLDFPVIFPRHATYPANLILF